MTASAALHSTPAMRTVASPKSNWARPGRWLIGTKTSLWCSLARATASCTWVMPPVYSYSSRSEHCTDPLSEEDERAAKHMGNLLDGIESEESVAG